MDIQQLIEKYSLDHSLDSEVISSHAQDASIFTVKPRVVIYPRTVEEIGLVVSSAQGNYFLSVRAGGTCMAGGSLTEGVILNLTKYLTGISIDADKRVATVEMGVMYRDLEKAAEAQGLLFPAYPSSRKICGVAGMLGNNASGEKSVRYGAVVKNVKRLWAVLSDGKEYEFGQLSREEFEEKKSLSGIEGSVYRALDDILSSHQASVESLRKGNLNRASGYLIERIRDSEGGTYNAASLFIGSQATLGVITKAELSLIPINPYKRLLAIPSGDLARLPDILETVMSYSPEGVETFDSNTFVCAKVCVPQDVERATQCMGGAKLMILAQFVEETQELTDEKANQCKQALQNKGYSVQYIEDEKLYESLWSIRRSSFGAMRDSAQAPLRAVPCIEDVIVPIQNFHIFVPEITNILKERNIQYGFHGHIGEGELRIIPVFDMSKEDAAEKIIELCRVVFALVKRLDGHMSADHSDGIIRSPFIRDFYGEEIYSVFSRIKNVFDPSNIFNPGKKIGGTEDLIKKYISK